MGLTAADWNQPPAIIAPEQLEQVKRKSRGDRRRPTTTGLAVGMIVLGGDGNPCRVVEITPSGQVFCVPVEQ